MSSSYRLSLPLEGKTNSTMCPIVAGLGHHTTGFRNRAVSKRNNWYRDCLKRERPISLRINPMCPKISVHTV